MKTLLIRSSTGSIKGFYNSVEDAQNAILKFQINDDNKNLGLIEYFIEERLIAALTALVGEPNRYEQPRGLVSPEVLEDALYEESTDLSELDLNNL